MSPYKLEFDVRPLQGKMLKVKNGQIQQDFKSALKSIVCYSMLS